jgi:flagellar hook-associated protein 2
LVTLGMSFHQQSYDLAKTQRDELNGTRAIYVDLQSKLSSLNTAAASLASSSSGSIFGGKSLTNSNADALTATASSSATVGTYDISVTTLAKAQRVRSEQQSYSNQGLGLSGTCVIGGLQDRAVSSESTVPDTVTDFGVGAAVTSGQRELGSGTYHVEARDNEGTKQFRIVDADGGSVSIADVDDDSSFTSNWQTLATVAGKTYDTGRGLTVNFDADGPYTTGLRGGAAASVRYDAQGVEVAVTASSTLADIASSINTATYASGNAVSATIVDRKLVLTAANTGERYKIQASDKTGTVLSGTGATGLGILGADGGVDDNGAADGFTITMQAASDNTMTVNDLVVHRASNTGLTDVISGVTLNLKKEGSTATSTLTVASNTTSVSSSVSGLLSQFNSLVSYLKTKTDTTQSTSGATTTYTRGGLAGDSTFYRLRFDLLSDLTRSVPRGSESALPAGDPTSLRAIGITMSDDLALSITDSAAFTTALSGNFEGTSRLFDKLMGRLTTRLEPYTRSTDSVMGRTLANVDSEIKNADNGLKEMQSRMAMQKASLERQYATIFNQIYAAQAEKTSLFG